MHICTILYLHLCLAEWTASGGHQSPCCTSQPDSPGSCPNSPRATATAGTTTAATATTATAAASTATAPAKHDAGQRDRLERPALAPLHLRRVSEDLQSSRTFKPSHQVAHGYRTGPSLLLYGLRKDFYPEGTLIASQEVSHWRNSISLPRYCFSGLLNYF